MSIVEHSHVNNTWHKQHMSLYSFSGHFFPQNFEKLMSVSVYS